MLNHKAVYKLYPNVVSVDDTEGAFDANGNQVEIDLELVNAWVDPETYKYQRQQAYPSIADQLDTLYHGGYNAWKAQIQAIKEQYPKD
jgi:hypothetical protein